MEGKNIPFSLSRLLLPAILVLLIFLFSLFSTVLYLSLKNDHLQYVRNEAMNVAGVIAAHIDKDKLDSLKIPDQEKSQTFIAIKNYLQESAGLNPIVDSVYTLRKTDRPDILSFVVDSQETSDLDGDGIIEPRERSAALGELYDASPYPEMQDGFVSLAADTSITRDKWGEWISGYAPVKDAAGNTIAVLGVDIAASHHLNFIGETRITIFTIGVFAITLSLILGFATTFLVRRTNKRITLELKKLDAIIKNSPVGIYTLRPDGFIDSFNPKMVELSGAKNASEVIGLNALRMGSYREVGLDKLFRDGLKGRSFFTQVPYTSQSGGKQTFRSYTGTPIFSENGKQVDRLLLMVEDITKQKEDENKIAKYSKNLEKQIAERTQDLQKKIDVLNLTEKAMMNILEDSNDLSAALKKERDRAAAVISSMGEGLILTDNNLRVILINQIGGALIHHAPADAVGKSLEQLIKLTKEDNTPIGIKNLLNKVIEQKDVLNFGLSDKVYCDCNSGGQRFPLSISIAPFLGDGVNGTVVVFQDISEERELDDAKENFISVASHQLRTPLTSVRWYSEMLTAGKMKNFSNKEKNYATHIYNGALRLNDTINLLLSLSRVESGKIIGGREKIDLSGAVNAILAELKQQIKDKKIDITMQIQPNSRNVICNQFALKQVLQNLLTNSLAYSKVHGKVTITARKLRNNTLISVRDEGIGIPQKEQPSIFQKFFRASNALRAVPDGSGLGLTLVKALVESWRGKVWFESEEGKGTVFHFSIPS